jgi:hypothetical protein
MLDEQKAKIVLEEIEKLRDQEVDGSGQLDINIRLSPTQNRIYKLVNIMGKLGGLSEEEVKRSIIFAGFKKILEPLENNDELKLEMGEKSGTTNRN